MLSDPRRLLLCALALVVVAASCNSGRASRVRDRADETRPAKVTHPLTGVSYDQGQPWESRPPLAVKIGNAVPERPQAGLDKADVVYEEIVEGGSTRFMAVFSTNDPGRVGPVRSARKVDPELLAPLNALFAYSGGAPSTIRVLRSSSGFTDVGVDRASGAYRRDPSRRSPYNLYTSTTELWSGRPGGPPAALFSFGAADSQEAASQVGLSFAGNGSDIRYAYDPATGVYTRLVGGSPHMAEGGVPLTYKNIVVQSVRISAGYSVDKAGFRTNDIATTGSGSLVVFREGKVLRGSWERASATEPARYVDEQGRPINLAPGNTIVELLPEGRPVNVLG
jgi:hypothetical protein